jgi:hypothetical protein
VPTAFLDTVNPGRSAPAAHGSKITTVVRPVATAEAEHAIASTPKNASARFVDNKG